MFFTHDCSLDSLKCNNTETYIDIHCNVLPSNKTTVTLREANGICREVLNNNLNDRSAKAEVNESVQTQTGLNKARTLNMTKTQQSLPAKEMTGTPEAPDTADATDTADSVTATKNTSATFNRKLEWFLKIQFHWQLLLSQKVIP